MKKLNKKVALILGTVVLALGAMAIPVFAETNQGSLYDKMNSYMNSGTMQNVHNSTVMQEAINSGDTNKMIDAMNSPEVKSQLGEEFVNQMNDMMKSGNMQGMMSSGNSMMGSGNSMMGSGNTTMDSGNTKMNLQ